MKRFPKLLVTLLLLAMVASIFAAMPVAAAGDYTAVRVKSAQITVGYYPDLSMTGDPVQNSANPNYTKEVGCLVDNDNNSAYWSTPFKFKDFKDQGGTKVPVILFDVAGGNDGNPVTIAGYDMRLRSYFDCMPFHFELQAITTAGSNNWTKIIEKSGLTWDTPTLRFEFPEVTVYKVRVLFYDIGDADIAKDSGYWDNLLGDETRFSLAEVDLLQKKEGGSDTGSSGSTTPTTGGSQTPTSRPVISFPTTSGGQTATQAPTQKPTQAPTQKPTQAPTQKPTSQPATQAPTTGGNQSATQAPTQKPTTNGGQTTTVAPTVAPTGNPSAPTVDPSAPTVEPTVDPSAPTVESTVDPSAPTVDPSAPTETTPVEPTEGEPTVAPTEGEPTQAPTTDATTPTTGNGGEEKPNNTWIIIVAIVAVAAVAGGAVFFIIKKKKQE